MLREKKQKQTHKQTKANQNLCLLKISGLVNFLGFKKRGVYYKETCTSGKHLKQKVVKLH